MTLRAVVMGVAGSGKSTVGAALARELGLPYRDGDDLHPPENIARMAAGQPLRDEDRWPWLARVAEVLHKGPGLIGCSALKRSYRDAIRAGAGAPVIFLHLTGPRAVIAARMAARPGHFMPPSLLDSQFAALEPPDPDEAHLTLDITRPLPELIAQAAKALR